MRWLALAAAAGLAPVALADTVQKGDLENGATLLRIQCAACHGLDGRGGGDLAARLPRPVGNLRDPAFLAAHSNDDLKQEILKGVPSPTPPNVMPASPWLSGLQLDDIIAFLRHDALQVTDFFPHAQYFIAKSYPLDAKAQGRIQKLTGQSVPASETTVTVVTLYGDGSEKGPVFVPQDPVQLDKLSPKDRRGYLVFADLPQGKSGRVTTGIAMDRGGMILQVHSEGGLAAPALDRAYQGYLGQGQKHEEEVLKVKGKGAPSPAEDKAFNLAYARAIQGIAMADAEEKDRHWADTN